jgi:hypothetical protein
MTVIYYIWNKGGGTMYKAERKTPAHDTVQAFPVSPAVRVIPVLC